MYHNKCNLLTLQYDVQLLINNILYYVPFSSSVVGTSEVEGAIVVVGASVEAPAPALLHPTKATAIITVVSNVFLLIIYFSIYICIKY